jgi:hypothetical protein
VQSYCCFSSRPLWSYISLFDEVFWHFCDWNMKFAHVMPYIGSNRNQLYSSEITGPITVSIFPVATMA